MYDKCMHLLKTRMSRVDDWKAQLKAPTKDMRPQTEVFTSLPVPCID